jgi:FKBP12-rapamycin complex-associated protein
MNKTPESLYEMNFYQLCGDDLKEAEKKLHKLLTKQKLNYLKEAWAIYQTVLKNIKSNYTNFQTISLQYISSKLFNFKNSNIIIPSFIHSYLYDVYDKNFPVKSNDLKQNIKPVKIKQIDKYLYILQTKYHPRKITMIGTNDKEYLYLLKGHEDLRQDEKVTQIFNLVNLIMSKEKTNYNLDLLIMVYSVIPLSNKSG